MIYGVRNIAGPLLNGMGRIHLLGQTLMQRPQRLQRDKNSASSKAPGGRNGFAAVGFIRSGAAAPATSSAVPERRTSRRVNPTSPAASAGLPDRWLTKSNKSTGHFSLQRPQSRQSAVVCEAAGSAAPVGQIFSQRPQWMQPWGGLALSKRQRETILNSRPVGQR